MSEFNFSFDDLLKLDNPKPKNKEPEEMPEEPLLNEETPKRNKRRKDVNIVKQELSIQVLRQNNQHLKRRIKSELNLQDAIEWHTQKEVSYHCISFGDVDSLSYLRFLLKQQPIEYLLLSTWCMAAADIVEIENWLEKGYIKRVDFYVGEIFTGTYCGEYTLLCDLCRKYGGRVCVFRNHSKVMAGFGSKFDFAIESSANINTNPRCENTVITTSTELAYFYKNFFDKVKSFERNFDNVKPYILERDNKGV